MKRNVISKVAVIAGMLFLMNSVSAADVSGQDKDRLEELLQAISSADEASVKAQLNNLKTANKLYLLNKRTMYYSPLGIVKDYLDYLGAGYGMDHAALMRIEQLLENAGAKVDYSSDRKEIARNYYLGNLGK